MRYERRLLRAGCPLMYAQGLVVFVIDGQQWTLDLREGAGSVTQGPPTDKPDLTMTISDENFAKMVMGKLSPQQVWLAEPGQQSYQASSCIQRELHLVYFSLCHHMHRMQYVDAS